MINRQCQECGGYELDNGVDDICDCEEDEEVGCKNDCGETVRFGGFCSRKCHDEYMEGYEDDDDW